MVEPMTDELTPAQQREAQKVAKAKRVKYAALLAKAEMDFDRWIGKTIAACNRVQQLRQQVKRYKKVVQS